MYIVLFLISRKKSKSMEKSFQYSFINNQHSFTINFINGAGFLAEISKIHNIGPHAIDFYKNTLLSSLHMLYFLKAGESLGLYIDSELPYYRFKIELGHTGSFRTLLLPEEFDTFPNKLNGQCRIYKFMPGRTPYTSLLEFKSHPIENLVNEIISRSYQVKSKIIIDTKNQNSLMITKLPPSNINKKIEDFSDLDLNNIEKEFRNFIKTTLQSTLSNEQKIAQIFQANNFQYLGRKQVHFYCPCSKERMIENLFTLPENERLSLFKKEHFIETRCDYCNTIYTIGKEEIVLKRQ